MSAAARLGEAPPPPAPARHAQPARNERFLHMHDAMRSPFGALGMLAIAALLGLAPLVPAIAAMLQVSFRETLPVAALFIACSGAAALLFRLGGQRSRFYLVVNQLETLITVAGVMFLIHAARSPGSVLWLFYFALVFHCGSTGAYRRYNGTLLGVGPLLLALSFAARGDHGGALFTLFPGLMGTLTYWQMSRASLRLSAALEAQERLQTQISDLLVHEERARIARDLHDGLAAELTGLFWRASTLQGELGDEATRGELREFMIRVRQSTDELRSVVWALRAEGQQLSELAAHLRGRCTELCAGTAGLDFSVALSADPVLPGELRMHMVRAVQEAVRNAVRHGLPAKISVRISADEAAVQIAVEDDGCGLPAGKLQGSVGGLKNIRTRLASVGGELTVSAPARGTLLQMRWPLPRAP